MDRRELDRIRRLAEAIACQAAKIEELRAEAYGGRGANNTGGSRAARVNKLEALSIRLVAEEDKLDELKDERHDAVEVAVRGIRLSIEDDKQRHILYLRYLAVDKQGHCLDWPRVLEIVHKVHKIQDRQIYKLHHIAIRKIESYNI